MTKPNVSFKNLNIGRKFTVSFFLFLMVPLLLLFLWINSSVKDRMRQENCRTNLAVLKQTKTAVDDLLQNLTYVSLQVIGNEQMQELFSNPQLQQKEKEELTKQVKYDIGALLSSKEYISGLSVFGNGEIYIQFGKYLLGTPEQFLEQIETQKGRIVWIPASVCEEYAFQRDRTYEIVMGRTINSHDIFEKPLAFEKINVEEEYLCSLYSGIAGSGTEKVFIMDSTGAVVSSTDKDMLGKNVSGEEFFQRITEQREGYFQINSGKDTVSFYCLSDPGWYVVKLDNTESLAGNGQPDTVIVACIVIALVFGVIFYRLQRRRIIRPLIQLAGDVENFHEGNYEIGTYSESKDEIGKLNDSFVSMSRYIKDLIEKVYKSQLREKEAQLKYLQSQINPHFLYNTLDSMRWMAVKQKQYELAEQIEALSNVGGTWTYQRWERNRIYNSDWGTTTGGDYEADIHESAGNDAYFEIPFNGTGITYMPCTNGSNTDSCSIYIDGKQVAENISLRTDTYVPQNEVFSIQNLENGAHILKVENTGSGQLVNDVVRVTKPAEKSDQAAFSCAGVLSRNISRNIKRTSGPA